jgi:hypothetical protein
VAVSWPTGTDKKPQDFAVSPSNGPTRWICCSFIRYPLHADRWISKKRKKKEPLRHLQETFNNNFQIFVFRVLVKTDPESG